MQNNVRGVNYYPDADKNRLKKLLLRFISYSDIRTIHKIYTCKIYRMPNYAWWNQGIQKSGHFCSEDFYIILSKYFKCCQSKKEPTDFQIYVYVCRALIIKYIADNLTSNLRLGNEFEEHEQYCIGHIPHKYFKLHGTIPALLSMT